MWIFVMRVMMIIASARLLLHQRSGGQGAVSERRQDELRNAADFAGMADVVHFDCADLR